MGDDEVCECQHTFLNCISLLFAFVFSPSLIYTLLYVVRIPTIHFLIFRVALAPNSPQSLGSYLPRVEDLINAVNLQFDC